MDRFYILLEKYLSGSLDASEEATFMEMIRSGVYDSLLNQRIDRDLSSKQAIQDMPSEKAAELLQKVFRVERQTREILPLYRKSNLRLWLGAAAAIALLFGTWWFLARPQMTLTGGKISATATMRSMVEKHGRQFVRLPDSSTVLLNANSQLSYPDSFPREIREVTMTGEGYFDIHPDAGKLFIVHAGGVDITVLGTAFNIKAYPSEAEVTVTVTRGKVKVSRNEQSYGIAASNQQIAVNLKDGSFLQSDVNADKSINWKRQYLILDNLNIKEAAALIGDKYHVNILLADDSLNQYKISATFLNNENLEQVLTVICGVIDATYTIQPNDQVIIRENK